MNDIFSGENSRELWASINSLDARSTGDDMRDVLYSLCCALQRLESKLAPAATERLAILSDYICCVEKLDNCRACLMRIAEKLGLEVTQSDELNTEWYDWVIEKLDGWSKR